MKDWKILAIVVRNHKAYELSGAAVALENNNCHVAPRSSLSSSAQLWVVATQPVPPPRLLSALQMRPR